jgi:iron complex outermembrane receptor protein
MLSILSISPLEAQEIKVLDQNTKEPILGLNFHYGAQSGVSDQKGNIKIEFQPDTNLRLSHLLYGTWSVTSEQVQKALELGELYRTEISYNLQPFTLIAIKPTWNENQKVMITDQERLHHDAGAILNLNPVVNGIRKSGAFAFDPVMRGFKYEQLNVVIDGFQTAHAACPNRMDPPTSQVVLNRIKQVEILKGPHALRYGIGLGGTLNFVQEDPVFSAEGGAYGRYSSMYESNGNIFRNEGRFGINGEKYDLGIIGSWSQGTNYVDGDGNQIPANFKRGTVGFYGDFNLTKRDLIQMTINRNFARDVDFPTLPMDLRSDDTWMGSLRHTRTFAGRNLKKWTTSGYFSLIDHLMDNGLRDIQPRMVNARTPANTQSLGGRTEGLWQLGNSKFYAGADFRSEAAQGKREREFLMGPNAGSTVFDNAWQDSQISKIGAFATYHLPFGANLLSLAGRLDVNQAIAMDEAPEFQQINPKTEVIQLNPGVSAGLQRELGDNFNMGFWLARVQRSGSITERFINFFPVGLDPYELVGNPELNPETNNQVDFQFGFNTTGLQVELSLFGAYLTDYITAEIIDVAPRMPSSPGVRQFINVGQAIKTGFELSYIQKIGRGIQHQVMVAYTYGENLSANEALPEIAPLDLRYAVTGSHFNDKLHTAIRIRHVMAQNRVSPSFGENSTPNFTLVDVDGSYAFHSKFSFKIGVQNLFDQVYFEHLNRPFGSERTPLFAPGRNIFVMLSLNLN